LSSQKRVNNNQKLNFCVEFTFFFKTHKTRKVERERNGKRKQVMRFCLTLELLINVFTQKSADFEPIIIIHRQKKTSIDVPSNAQKQILTNH
jgi:hypothetical protein